MKKLLLAVVVLVVLLACNKDKYQTKPQISVKSVATDDVPVNGDLTVVLSYTDKEGDISDSLFIKKIRLNKTVVATLRDSLKYKIPDMPDYSKGEITVALDYQNNLISAVTAPPVQGSNPPQPQPDTLLIRMWIHDKAGNTSDTVNIGPVAVRR
jgi:hypothetical protein